MVSVYCQVGQPEVSRRVEAVFVPHGLHDMRQSLLFLTVKPRDDVAMLLPHLSGKAITGADANGRTLHKLDGR